MSEEEKRTEGESSEVVEQPAPVATEESQDAAAPSAENGTSEESGSSESGASGEPAKAEDSAVAADAPKAEETAPEAPQAAAVQAAAMASAPVEHVHENHGHGDHGHDDHGHGGHGHVAPMKMLLGVLGALLILTIMTVMVTAVDLGSQWNFVVAMIIATVKAVLVMAYFMHLAHDSKFNVVVFTSSFLFVLLFLSMALLDRQEYQPRVDEFEAAAKLQSAN